MLHVDSFSVENSWFVSVTGAKMTRKAYHKLSVHDTLLTPVGGKD